MGYAKERKKLEELLPKVSAVKTYDKKSLEALNNSYEKYSHTVRILKNKAPDLFGDLYKNELQAVKDGKKSVTESETDEARQLKFIEYKEIVLRAVEKTITTTLGS